MVVSWILYTIKLKCIWRLRGAWQKVCHAQRSIVPKCNRILTRIRHSKCRAVLAMACGKLVKLNLRVWVKDQWCGITQITARSDVRTRFEVLGNCSGTAKCSKRLWFIITSLCSLRKTATRQVSSGISYMKSGSFRVRFNLCCITELV